ncbi:hypothetical protein L209DRAFT_396687 [Thermothelomyces heterothallicus CBS 203.75]
MFLSCLFSFLFLFFYSRVYLFSTEWSRLSYRMQPVDRFPRSFFVPIWLLPMGLDAATVSCLAYFSSPIVVYIITCFRNTD